MKTLQRLSLLVCASALLFGVASVSAAEVDDNISNYLQLLRSDFNSAKVGLVNRIMNLSAEDAKTFWPIYRNYENEFGKLAVARAEFISEFIQANKNGTFDNDKAKDMAKRWFKSQRARLDLLEKYHRQIEKNLSSIHAAQFLQIEHQIGIFIDVEIASEMPMIGEAKR